MFFRNAALLVLSVSLFAFSPLAEQRTRREGVNSSRPIRETTGSFQEPERRSAASEALHSIRLSVSEVLGLVEELNSEGLSEPAEFSRAIGRSATALFKADLAMLRSFAEIVFPAQYDFDGAWTEASSSLSEAYKNFSFASLADLEQKARDSLSDDSHKSWSRQTPRRAAR